MNPEPYEIVVFCDVQRESAAQWIQMLYGKAWNDILPADFKCTDGQVLPDPAEGAIARIRLTYQKVQQTDEYGKPIGS